MTVHDILDKVQSGDFNIAYNNSTLLDTIDILLKTPDDQVKNNPQLLQDLVDIITIGNIIYNYSDRDVMAIDDGIYDLLVVKLQKIDYSKFNPGAKPVTINKSNDKIIDKDLIRPIAYMGEEDIGKLNNSLYPEILNYNKPFDPRCYLYRPFYIEDDNRNVSKRLRNVSHNYPDLVGTLEKCKFVLDCQAKEAGAYEEPNVKIFERDFMVPLLMNGVINSTDDITMIGTLKYDGISIEADVTDHVISARTRGDTDMNIASDLTPILEGYRFPNAEGIIEEPIGMKFEAIVRYDDLGKMNEIFGTSYINGRTAIIGILGSSDAYKYRNFITLVPLQADFNGVAHPDRLAEIEFLNKYYATKEYLRYTIFKGNYANLLFQIKKYAEEAEYFRAWSRFMYDGVVLEFFDENIRKLLGRKNSINQYAMAIKFNPLTRYTIFTGFSYTVGQNGVITPMIHYTPIEFMGAIHNKSTGSSYERFNNLDLYIGDEIQVKYVNDVMPYVYKVDSEYNRQNHMREKTQEEMFPTKCPSCGSDLKLSNYGKTMYCPNMACDSRRISRLVNMLAKLGIKDFAESAVESLHILSFRHLMNMSVDDMRPLGPTDSIKLYRQIQEIKTKGLPDYQIIGALGFTNIATKKWKIIFSKYTLKYIYDAYMDESIIKNNTLYENLVDLISNIKGVGPITAETIVNEFEFFKEDIEYILYNITYTPTFGSGDNIKYKIRFSGFRDAMLESVLNGFEFIDVDQSATVTKDTTLLLVSSLTDNTSKVQKAKKYGVPIVTIMDFLEHPAYYIPEMEDVDL